MFSVNILNGFSVGVDISHLKNNVLTASEFLDKI
jgi:hypothetical protein